MPVVIPQYIRPESITAEGAFRGIETQNSAMERAQLMRLRQERADQERQLFNQQQAEYIATAPVRVAARQMEIASAQGKIAAAVQMQNLMTTAQSEMPNLRARWNATSQLDDPNERLMEQERVLGMADRYAGLKDVGEEINQWHNLWAQGTINQRTRDTLSGRLAQAQIGAETKIAVADKTQQALGERQDKALNAQRMRSEQLAAERAALPTNRVKILNEAIQQAKIDGDAELEKALRARLARENAIAHAGNSIADVLREELNKPAEPQQPGLVDRALSSLGFGSKTPNPASSAPATALIAAPQENKEIPRPKTREERDKLPKGSPYIGPDGKTYIKGE